MALQCHELFPILLYIVLLVSLALQKTARYNSENTRNIGKKQKMPFFTMQDLCCCYLSKIVQH